MDIAEKDKILVNEEDGKIFFKYSNDDDKSMDLTMCCLSENEIVCQIINKVKLGYDFQNKQEENMLYIERIIAELKENGEVDFISKMVSFSNDDCERIDELHCKAFVMHNFYQHKHYDSNGIVMVRESINFKPIKTGLYSNYTIVGEDIPLIAINHFDVDDRFSEKSKLVRDKLDTAYFYLSSCEYNEPIEQEPLLVPLDTKNGLQEMSMASLDNISTGVPALTVDRIEQLIKGEPNAAVQNGLRALAVGRDKPSYGFDVI